MFLPIFKALILIQLIRLYRLTVPGPLSRVVFKAISSSQDLLGTRKSQRMICICSSWKFSSFIFFKYVTVLWVRRHKIHSRKRNHHHDRVKSVCSLIKAYSFDQNVLIWGMRALEAKDRCELLRMRGVGGGRKQRENKSECAMHICEV